MTSRFTQSSTRALAKERRLALDKLVALTLIDFEIGCNYSTTVALEATAEQLQASKKAPIPNLTQRIQQLTKENSRL